MTVAVQIHAHDMSVSNHLREYIEKKVSRLDHYLPAISEAGLRGYDVSVWMGIVAPAGTPPAIIAQLNRQIGALLQSPDIRERLAVQGLEAASNSPAEFRSYIASEVRKWAVVIKQAGVVAD